MKSLIASITGFLLAVQVSAAPAANEPKQIASQWYEAFARHDAALLEKILTPSWVDIPSPPDAPHGPEAAKALMAILVGAFPDFDIQVEDIRWKQGCGAIHHHRHAAAGFCWLTRNWAIHEDSSRRHPRNREW
jgi:SnoaL-like domain